MASRPPLQVVVSCEHASCAVPRELRGLGLSPSALRRHIGWDPGAMPVARGLARTLRAPLFAGRWSRLVVDLNRSDVHPRVIAARSGGVVVSGNMGLSPHARDERLRRWWRPYRAQLERAARTAAARGDCVHLSVHSFVERLGGVERTHDIGLLFDPRRPRERALVTALQRALAAQGLRARKNAPYFGHTDGVTTHLRSVLPATRYRGIEIELNQRRARTVAGQRTLLAALRTALSQVLEVAS